MVTIKGNKMDKKETACFINGNQYNQFTDMEKTLYVIGMIDSILILFYMVDIEKYQTIRNKVKDMTSLEIRKLLDDYLNQNSYVVRRSIRNDNLSESQIKKLILIEESDKDRKSVIKALKEKLEE
jgi:hypothetical protein